MTETAAVPVTGGNARGVGSALPERLPLLEVVSVVHAGCLASAPRRRAKAGR